MVVAPATLTDEGKWVRNAIGYFATRTQAEKALADYIFAPYDVEEASRATFGEIYEKWYAKATAGVSESTAKTYVVAARRLDELMPMRLRDIRFQQLDAVFSKHVSLSFSSLNQMKHLVSAVYETAIKMEIASKNYALDIDIGKAEKSTKHTIYSDDEIYRLWNTRTTANSANELILIYTGLRPREAVIQPITAEDIERGWFVAIGNKNDNSRGRCVPIHPCIAPLLEGRKYLLEQSRKDHSPISYSRLYTVTTSMGHLPHDGRHTAATLMKRYHVDEYARKRILGHAGGNVTDDVYTHVDGEYLKNEMMKVPSPDLIFKL